MTSKNPLPAESTQKRSKKFFISGERHDRDRIEIQLGCDELTEDDNYKINYQVDLLLFAPLSLGLTEVDHLDYIRQEFRSYIRLNSTTANPKHKAPLNRVYSAFRQMKQQDSFDSVSTFATELNGFIKSQSLRLKRLLRNPVKESTLLLQLFKDTDNLLNEFRSFLKSKNIFDKNLGDFEVDSVEHTLILLNEYISHLYIQFLGKSKKEIQRHELREDIAHQLTQYSQQEFKIRIQLGFLTTENIHDESISDEDYLHRISLLKKYFQKRLFIKSTDINLQNRALIPAYAFAAAIAAALAVSVQIWSFEQYGANMVAIASLAISAYIVKDLLKHYFRKQFLETGSRWLPDIKRNLYVKRHKKRISLGYIKEYLNTYDINELPEQLIKTRYSNPITGNLERKVKEEVLHFKKRVHLNLSKISKDSELDWGVREVLRYQFDRLIRSTDDAFKTLYLASKKELPKKYKAHRVYQVYAAAWISDNSKNTPPAFKAFNIEIDKSGIISCTSLPWKKEFGIPPRP